MSDVLAIVPARAGSKGIVDKNLTDLCGRPLIGYTIDAARAASCITRTIVSTDSPAIAEVARGCGAEVPFMRPAELAGDATPMMPVVLHAIDWLATHDGFAPDVIALLQPTSPLRTAADIDAAVGMLLDDDGADAVVSVIEARTHPALTRIVDGNGRLQPFLPGVPVPVRRQGVEGVYELNGAIYAARTGVLRTKQTWHTDRTLAYVMPADRSVDVDEPLDMTTAAALLAAREAGDD
jgi:CMP-N,N'-diacetyllegionaminic acid synthase